VYHGRQAAARRPHRSPHRSGAASVETLGNINGGDEAFGQPALGLSDD
jgi:hypothetical protein